MESPFTSTKFSELIKKFLKAQDSYNSTDLLRSTASVDRNTSGEVAGICLNLALHKCYDLVKDSKYLKNPPTQNLKSTADQNYIELDVEPTLDEIESVLDTTNNFKLIKKSWAWYRRNFPNPSTQKGTPSFYIHHGDRMYLAPTPSAVIPYLSDFVRFKGDLVEDDDCPALPSQYDYWIIAEAMVEWAKMEDMHDIPQAILTERDDARDIATDAIMSGFDDAKQLASNFNRIGHRTSFDRITFDNE